MALNKYLDHDDESMHCVNEYTRANPDDKCTLMYEEILKLVPDAKGECVLDVGCAGGYYTSRLDELGKSVIGISINQKDIDHLNTLGLSGRLCDMHDLMFKDNTIDGIFCSHTLEHSTRPYEALSEFRRVLRPDGWLLLVMPEAAGRIVGGWRRSVDFGHHYFFPTAEMLMDMLVNIGFKDVWFTRFELRDPNASVSVLYYNHIWLAKKCVS